jgi:hypothetical protein
MERKCQLSPAPRSTGDWATPRCPCPRRTPGNRQPRERTGRRGLHASRVGEPAALPRDRRRLRRSPQASSLVQRHKPMAIAPLRPLRTSGIGQPPTLPNAGGSRPARFRLVTETARNTRPGIAQSFAWRRCLERSLSVASHGRLHSLSSSLRCGHRRVTPSHLEVGAA